MNRLSRALLLLLASLLIVATAGLQTAVAQPTDTSDVPFTDSDTTEKGAPYVPTPDRIVWQMLELADVSEDDVVYDLGSGDGRIVLAAAQKFGARGVGIEIDPELVEKARAKAEELGVDDRVEFRRGDLFEADLSEATVVTLYLWPDMNNRLRPKLQEDLDPGDRIVSHSFDIDDWPADSTISVGDQTLGDVPKTLFRWTIRDSTGDGN